MNDNFMHNLRAAVDRLVPSYTVAHNARGNELVDSGGYDTAIAEFDEAIRLTSFVAEIYSDHGRAHAVKGTWASPSPTTTKQFASIRTRRRRISTGRTY